MNVRLLLVVSIAGVLFGTRPAGAHHSFAAEFDINKPVTIEGILTKMEWINPHGWIYVDVKKPDGTIEHWSIEAGAPNQLIRRGVRKDDFPAGIEVVVTGYRSRNNSTTANGQSVKLKDGRNFFMGSVGSPGDPGNTTP